MGASRGLWFFHIWGGVVHSFILLENKSLLIQSKKEKLNRETVFDEPEQAGCILSQLSRGHGDHKRPLREGEMLAALRIWLTVPSEVS